MFCADSLCDCMAELWCFLKGKQSPDSETEESQSMLINDSVALVMTNSLPDQ